MAQTSSLAALYGLRGQGASPGAMDIGVLSRAYGRGPAGPFDISYPFMGLALGRSIRSFRENAEVTALLEEAQKRELPAKWAAAVQADPELATSAPKMVNWMMTNAPEMLGKMGDIFGAYRASAEAKRTEALTPAEKEEIQAKAFRTGVTAPALDIARAGEAQARTGLLGAQTTTEGFRPSLLGAQTETQKSLAGLYGERGITEAQKRPYSLQEIQAGTERLKALTGKLKEETRLMPERAAGGFKEAKLKEMWDQLSEEAKLKVIGALPADKELTENNILSAYANLMTDPAIREQLKPMVDEILRRTMQKRGPEVPESGRPPVVFK